LYRHADILILDEPTGVLTPQEADQLFRVLRSLKERGVTVILITHKLREIIDITDEVSVLRLGQMVAHRHTADTSMQTPDDVPNPSEMRELRINHVPEDRLKLGLVKSFSAAESSLLGYQRADRFNWRGFLRLDVVRDLCASLMRGFDVRPVNPKLRSASFSGGNQQKLILARELDKSPDVLLTRRHWA